MLELMEWPDSLSKRFKRAKILNLTKHKESEVNHDTNLLYSALDLLLFWSTKPINLITDSFT